MTTTLGSLSGGTGGYSTVGFGQTLNYTIIPASTAATTSTFQWSPTQQNLQYQQAALAAQQAASMPRMVQGLGSAGMANPYANIQQIGQVAAPASRLPTNRFLAASDLLEDFIRYVGPHGVTKAEFRKLPMELFIQWLVLEAAKLDDEDVAGLPDPVLMLTHQPVKMTDADLGIESKPSNVVRVNFRPRSRRARRKRQLRMLRATA